MPALAATQALLLVVSHATFAGDTLAGHVIANGGATQSQGGDYVLTSTIGEPAAGPVDNATLALDGGFLQPSGLPGPDTLFNDGFED